MWFITNYVNLNARNVLLLKVLYFNSKLMNDLKPLPI